jgi:hypothetical protein
VPSATRSVTAATAARIDSGSARVRASSESPTHRVETGRLGGPREVDQASRVVLAGHRRFAAGQHDPDLHRAGSWFNAREFEDRDDATRL